MARNRDESAEPQDGPRGMPTWKKLLLALAAVFVVAGIGLRLAAEPTAPPSSGPGGEYGTAFLDGGSTVEEPRGAGDWSPFFLQGGFGFFVGFSIGTVLRTFFKLFAFGAGLLFLLLLGLQYAGVEIPWERLQETYDAVAGRLSEHAEGFLAFLQGAIPAAAFSGAGLVAGLKR